MRPTDLVTLSTLMPACTVVGKAIYCGEQERMEATILTLTGWLLNQPHLSLHKSYTILHPDRGKRFTSSKLYLMGSSSFVTFEDTFSPMIMFPCGQWT